MIPAQMTLPTEVVLNLINFAGRAQLHRDEWRYLETWEGRTQDAIALAQQKEKEKTDAATPPANPPQEKFDPTTAAAEAKRERRRQRRLAAKNGELEKMVGTGKDGAAGAEATP